MTHAWNASMVCTLVLVRSIPVVAMMTLSNTMQKQMKGCGQTHTRVDAVRVSVEHISNWQSQKNTHWKQECGHGAVFLGVPHRVVEEHDAERSEEPIEGTIPGQHVHDVAVVGDLTRSIRRHVSLFLKQKVLGCLCPKRLLLRGNEKKNACTLFLCEKRNSLATLAAVAFLGSAGGSFLSLSCRRSFQVHQKGNSRSVVVVRREREKKRENEFLVGKESEMQWGDFLILPLVLIRCSASSV